jgi:hypothetical protein
MKHQFVVKLEGSELTRPHPALRATFSQWEKGS